MTSLMRRPFLIGLVAVALVIGASFGVARAALRDTSSPVPNTAGSGGHARALAGGARADLTQTERDVLAASGVTSASVLASIGGGSHTARLLAAPTPTGTCLTVSHANGNIVEPLNCSSDAYLRVWHDASGSAAASGIANAQSFRIIAVASAEVASVSVTFANGSSRTFTPDSRGVVTLEGGGGAHRATSVAAFAADGSQLASIGV